MHDHDDPEDQGRVLYSGFNPHAQRADYALPPGVPALQGEGAEFELPGSWDGVSRRGVLVLGLVAGGAASLAGWFGWFSPTAPDSRIMPGPAGSTPRPDWVDHLIKGSLEAADGPIEDLVVGYPTFLMVVRTYGGDDVRLWQGMERLAKFAELDRSQKGYEIATRMLDAFRFNPPPPAFAHLRLSLRDFVRRWEARGK